MNEINGKALGKEAVAKMQKMFGLHEVKIVPNADNVVITDETVIEAYRDGSFCSVLFSFYLKKKVTSHQKAVFQIAAGLPKPARSFFNNTCKANADDGIGRIGVSSTGILGFYDAPSDLPADTRIDGSFTYPISQEEE